MTLGDLLQSHLARRELQTPDRLRRLYDSDLPDALGATLLRPVDPGVVPPHSIGWAEAEINRSRWPLLPNLVPIHQVDEQSFACVVVSSVDDTTLPHEGRVVRWHLELSDRHVDLQAGLLDTDCYEYAKSVRTELDGRAAGLDLVLDVIGPAYESSYLGKGERPRDHVVRPLRLACQNVIVGLAAIAQDATFDGLTVSAWQTCERPHIATHEANRALAVVMLCDAFQNGGTMEIRFDRWARLTIGSDQVEDVRALARRRPATVRFARGRDDQIEVVHPERAVPASLRRFGRTIGVALGCEDRDGPAYASISPAQTRMLFRAVTPMPDGLRSRVERAERELGVTPERLCYMLLKPVWRDVELDYLLATSDRVASILRGGADWRRRIDRQAESEVCRAAVMVGMLFRRLDSTDPAGADGEVRVVEASTVGVRWDCLEDVGAIRFTSMREGPVPWLTGPRRDLGASLLVFPRVLVTEDVIEVALARARKEATAVVVPRGIDVAQWPSDLLVLRCPDRLADIDRTIEEKLVLARTSRG